MRLGRHLSTARAAASHVVVAAALVTIGWKATVLYQRCRTYLGAIEVLEQARPWEVRKSDLLSDKLYVADRISESGKEPAPVLLLVTDATACSMCDEGVEKWTAAVSRMPGQAVELWEVNVAKGLSGCGSCTVGSAPPVITHRLIHDRDEFLWVSGITSLPAALLFDSNAALRSAVFGVPSDDSIATALTSLAIRPENRETVAAPFTTFESNVFNIPVTP